jgi:hypothetical protein
MAGSRTGVPGGAVVDDADGVALGDGAGDEGTVCGCAGEDGDGSTPGGTAGIGGAGGMGSVGTSLSMRWFHTRRPPAGVTIL